MAVPISFHVTRYLECENNTNDLNLDVEAMSFSQLLHPRNERLANYSVPYI